MRRFLLFSIVFWVLMGGIGSNIPVLRAQDLVGHWTFEPGEEQVDRTGNFRQFDLFNTRIEQGRLRIDSFSHARAYDYIGPSILMSKTLVLWLEMEDLNIGVGHPFGIYAPGSGFSEQFEYSGDSHLWRIYSTDLLDLIFSYPEVEERLINECIQLTFVQEYKGREGIQSFFYRNQELVGSYTERRPRPYHTAGTEVYWGGNLLPGPEFRGCRIEEARIYARALGPEEVRALSPLRIQPSRNHIWGYGLLALGLGGMAAGAFLWRRKRMEVLQ